IAGDLVAITLDLAIVAGELVLVLPYIPHVTPDVTPVLPDVAIVLAHLLHVSTDVAGLARAATLRSLRGAALSLAAVLRVSTPLAEARGAGCATALRRRARRRAALCLAAVLRVSTPLAEARGAGRATARRRRASRRAALPLARILRVLPATDLPLAKAAPSLSLPAESARPRRGLRVLLAGRGGLSAVLIGRALPPAARLILPAALCSLAARLHSAPAGRPVLSAPR